MKKLLSTLFLLAVVGGSWSQQADRKPKKDVRDVISQEQFTKAGLDKLTSNELQELSGALYGWQALELPKSDPVTASGSDSAAPAVTESSVVKDPKPVVTARQEQEFGREVIKEKQETLNKKSEPKEIVTSIQGEFKGWSGNTVFRLENGQVWRQSDKSKFHVREMDPKVEIEKGFLGTYFLSIEGYGARCKVKRVH